jgi:tRNA(Ile)-lysidine synthase TilS/MesJ
LCLIHKGFAIIVLSLLAAIYASMKHENRNKDYDCILGLSGGVDSSYLALKLFDAGIRPLVVHVDGGWNSELAVQNIENIVNYCGWHLHTIVIDWEEMRDLQLAYMKSGIANQDVPQDHAFFAHYTISLLNLI